MNRRIGNERRSLAGRLTIRKAQREVAKYLEAKGEEWTRINDHYYLVAHLVEEVGELARGIINVELKIEEPRRRGLGAPHGEKLGAVEDAVGDILYQLFKIATAYGIDMEDAFQKSMHNIRRRYPTGTL